MLAVRLRESVVGWCLGGVSHRGNRRGEDGAAGVEKHGAAVDPGRGDLSSSFHGRPDRASHYQRHLLADAQHIHVRMDRPPSPPRPSRNWGRDRHARPIFNELLRLLDRHRWQSCWKARSGDEQQAIKGLKRPYISVVRVQPLTPTGLGGAGRKPAMEGRSVRCRLA